MAIERIDSIMDLPAIQQELSGLKTGLAESQKGLVDLYNLIKGFKDTNITTLAANTDKLAQAINGSVQATANAAKNYDALAQKIAQQTSAIRDNAAAITGSNQAYDQLIKQSVRNKLASDELTKSAKEVKAAFERNETTFEQYTASLESIKTAQQQLKISNADITKGLNNLERQAQSSGTSIDGLKAKLNLLTQAYDKLSEEERGSEGGQGLLKNIQETDAAFKKLKEDTGRFQDTVGNYSGAFGQAFNVLKEQLAAVKGQMGDLETKGKAVVNNLTGGNPIGFDPNRFKGHVTSLAGKGGEQVNVPSADAATYQELTNKAQFLENTVERLAVGFKTTRQESRAFQEAAVQLGLAVGQTDQKFLVFNEAVGETQNAINDIKAATKFQAQDAKLIVGLTSAVTGLVGAYGAASAAVSLMGNDDEDAQKQMAKFQQLLVLINGLQQVTNALQTESGAVQLALAAKTSLLSAATKIQTLINGEALKVIQQEIAANIELAESQEGVAVTAEEAAVAIQEIVASNAETTAAALAATAALAAEAGAAELATTSTTGFTTAVIASGIGVIIIAIGAAVAYLIVKIQEWTSATTLNTKQQKELNDALATQIEALQKINDLQDSAGKKNVDILQHQLDLEEKSGQNQYAIFAIKEKIAAKNAEIADAKYAQVLADAENKYIKEGLIGIEALHRAQNDYFEDLTDKSYKVSVVQKELDNALSLSDQQRKKIGLSDKQIERIKDRLAAAQAEQNLAQKNYDFYNKGEKDRTDTQNEQENLRIERAKFSADEQRRLILETTKLEVDAQKDKNSKILADQASTLQERLAAIRSNAQQEKKAAEAEFKNVQSDPSTTPTQLLEAHRKLNAAFAQADRDAAKATQDTNRSYYEKDRDARLEIYKQSVQDSLKYDQDILSKKIGHGDNDTTGDKKLGALTSQLNLQRALAEQNRQQDLDAEGLTNEQKIAINKKYNSELENLNIDFLKSQRELEKEIRDATLADWDQYYEDRKTQLDKETNAEIAALNDRLVKRKISQQKYDDEIKLINDKNALDSINLEVMNDYIKVQAYKEGTKEKSDAEKKLTDDLKAQNDAQTKGELDKQEIARAKVIRTLQDVEEQSQNYGSAILDVINIGYNTQKIHLEELEARQQRAYEQNAKNISNTSASEEQKAIRLKILDDQRAQQKEINDRKQRSLDIQKAQFDKAKDILGIITGTALAVVKALPNIPLAVSVGILGAAELTAAIATPLPKYKHGTDDHPGGLAVTGDGGVSELILEPGKLARWSASRPTIESLLPHTKVMPPEKIEEMIMSGMFVNQRGTLIQQHESGNKQELREIRDAIVWSAQQQKEAIKTNKPKIVNRITISSNWHSYIHNSVFK